jgi:hypothetical protein
MLGLVAGKVVECLTVVGIVALRSRYIPRLTLAVLVVANVVASLGAVSAVLAVVRVRV